MYKGAIVGCGAVASQAHVPAWRTAPAFRMVAAVDPISKPLTFTAAALQRIMAAASAANVLVFSVHNWKYAPIFQALKGLLTADVIGTPAAVELTTLRTKPAGTTGWRLDPQVAGGGILLDHGWHAFYLLLFLLEARPQTIAASVERRLFLSAGVEDTVTCDVTFPQAQARIHLTWAASQRRNLVVVRGERGEIHLDDARLVVRQQHAVQEIVFPAALSAGSTHPDWCLTLLAYRSAAQDAQPLACMPALDLAAV